MFLERQRSRRKEKCHYIQVTPLLLCKEVLHHNGFRHRAQKAESPSSPQPFAAVSLLCRYIDKTRIVILDSSTLFPCRVLLWAEVYRTCLWVSLKRAVLKKFVDKLHQEIKEEKESNHGRQQAVLLAWGSSLHSKLMQLLQANEAGKQCRTTGYRLSFCPRKRL